MERYRNGTCIEEWYKDGKLHREDGPAYIFYEADGTIRDQQWWQNNRSVPAAKAWASVKAAASATLLRINVNNKEI